MITVIISILVSYSALLVHGGPLFITFPPPIKDNVDLGHRVGVNPEQLGGGFDGDMFFPMVSSDNMNRGAAYNVKKWPNGIVPYDISAITNAADRTLVENAMHHVVYNTGSPITNSTSRTPCVYFRPKTASDQTFLTIVYGQGCNAHVGYYVNYPLKLTLQKDSSANCFHSGTVQHELLHVLGFKHEQSRPDRDNYVQINYGNIDTQWHYAFDKLSWDSTAIDLKTPYDYSSIMHYGRDYFSKNGQPTIVPKQANAPIGSREKLSVTDILEVRRLYGCQA